jgi:transposase InsO family protein
LDRQFTVLQPNQTYVGDITYIHTLEGWLYLASNSQFKTLSFNW